MREHTPGPWTVEVDQGSVVVWSKFKSQKTGDDGDDRHVVAIPDWGPMDKREADARLIAAAPDMLAALQMMLDAHGGLEQSPAAKAARAAIARATGAA